MPSNGPSRTHPGLPSREAAPQELLNCRAPELLAHYHTATLINAVNLENMLGKIKPDGDIAHVDGHTKCGCFDAATLWHLDAGG